MKRGLCIIWLVIMAITLAACGAPAATVTPEASDSTPAVVTFDDPVLEAMAREAMGKSDGDITAEEAEAVTKMDLGIEWQQDIPEDTQIKDLSGIENFKNLEELALHFHAITDISPLAGLKKLTSLSLGGNPVADITPLSGLTNLGWLTLFNCQAQDYASLANLTDLTGLLMDHSTISDVSMLSGLTGLTWLGIANTQVSDVSPLSTLVNLKKLQLAGCPITDYSPLAEIYPNLEEADFTIVASLRELGFAPIDNAPQVESYKTEEMYVQVNHTEWGEQENKDQENAVILCKNFGTENEIVVIYYPDNKGYLVYSQSKDFRYTYDSQNEKMSIEYGEGIDAFMEEVYDEVDPYPVMTPIRDFSSIMTDTFGASADILYNLPRETIDASSLTALGFTADQENACYLYEQHDPYYYSVQINNPGWGSWEEGGDVSVFTPLSDKYRIVVTYTIDEKKFAVKADDNDGGGASFEYFIETHEHVDGWCSNEGMTVEEYFINAYNDPEIKDIYLHSVELIINYIEETFGMSIEELYALPAGE